MGKNVLVQLMEKELIPALGCTEPMAFALAAAMARKYAPGEIKHVHMDGSGLMVIGVQSVGIPRTGGKRGGLLSSAIGVIAGDADLDMEVLSKVTEADVEAAEKLVAAGKLSIDMVTPAPSIYLKTTVETDRHTASVMMQGEHNGIQLIEQDGKIIFDKRKPADAQQATGQASDNDKKALSVDSIYDFCKNCDIGELAHIRTAIDLTRALCKDGLDNGYGMQVARTLQDNVKKGAVADDEFTNILIWTIAGIDARMGGSSYTAMSNTGSGNQGIICTTAPLAAGEYRKSGEEEIIRAVALSNLLNIFIDYHSNEYAHLSPMCYCGGVAPAAAAGGVAFLHGADKKQISNILRTSLGNLPGIICDGAKAACAFKSYTGLCASLQSMLMAEKGLGASNIDGIVNDSVEVTIDNIYRLQKECMTTADAFVYKVKKEQGSIC